MVVLCMRESTDDGGDWVVPRYRTGLRPRCCVAWERVAGHGGGACPAQLDARGGWRRAYPYRARLSVASVGGSSERHPACGWGCGLRTVAAPEIPRRVLMHFCSLVKKLAAQKTSHAAHTSQMRNPNSSPRTQNFASPQHLSSLPRTAYRSHRDFIVTPQRPAAMA